MKLTQIGEQNWANNIEVVIFSNDKGVRDIRFCQETAGTGTSCILIL